MKMKNRSNVHYFDQQRKKTKKSNNKINNSKTVSIMTYCQCCKKQTMKKNRMNDFYLCDSCYDLKSNKIYINNEMDIQKEILQYINWDDDIDYLYHHFWLDN